MPEKAAKRKPAKRKAGKGGGRRGARDEVDRSAVRARSFWSGTISFGLVSIPVDLLPAQRASGPSMTLLGPEGAPLSRRYYEPESGREVRGDEVLRGYEAEPGRFVIVEDEELEALAPEKTRVIALEVFVPAGAVDPVFFQRGYFLTPAGESNKPYRLLAEALERTERVGIATFVMRGKEYLVAILSEGGILRAEVLRFADEIRTPEAIGLPEPETPAPKRVKELATEIGKAARADFDPEELRDEEALRLERAARKKLKAGKDVAETEEAAAPAEEIPDLMNVLRWSLRQEGGEGGGRRESA
ncbi:MAG TPA: Ku protein [Thermoanaerobaculia bacterium]